MPQWQPPHLPQADVLVLAGDIGSYQEGSLLHGQDRDWALSRFSPLQGWPTPVFFVPGNHEYDGFEYDEAHAALRACCERLGIQWLHHEQIILDGVRFVGSTLWTDFDALSLQRQRRGESVSASQALEWRGKAFRAANHYLQKTSGLVQGQAMLAPHWRELGLASQAWLGQALHQEHDGQTVVVTHFAPSLQSSDPRYVNNRFPGQPTPGTAGFCNVLDEWFDLADVWLHGHLHCPHDYRAGRDGGCRVVCNPMGYADKGEQLGFRPDVLIEV